MKKKLILLLLYSLFYKLLPAQQIDTTMRWYAENNRIEKIHIHFDRSVYRKGETIYYKLYLTDEFNGYPQSKTVYLNWYDITGKLLRQTTSPILLASAAGSFTIPSDYNNRAVGVKAYTKKMLNDDKQFIYSKYITVFQNTAIKSIATSTATSTIRIFPEGGFAVEGLHNSFAVCASNADNMPVAMRGVVKNNKGETIDSVYTGYDGMGFFSMQTKGGEQYTLEWKDVNGLIKTKQVNIEKKVGACLHVTPHRDNASFTVERSAGADATFRLMHLLIHRNYELQYKIDLNLSEKNILTSTIPTSDLPTGIIQFTLFDTNWLPVAERIVFVNNHNYSFYPKIEMEDDPKDSMTYIDIDAADTLLTNMSMSVANAVVADSNDADIISDLLLKDELKGKVNCPDYYFSAAGNAKEDSIRRQHLDLIMLTYGHRRYDWEKIRKGILPPVSDDTAYLSIEGTLKSSARHVKGNSVLNVMLTGKDKSKQFLAIPLQKDGKFRQENVLLYDTIQVFANLNGAPVDKNDITFFENNLPVRVPFETKETINDTFNSLNFQQTEKISEQAKNFLAERDKLDSLKRNTTMKEVVVTTKVKPRMQVLDDYYARGVFNGDQNSYAIDVEGDIHASGNNIWMYLESKIPGFKAVHNGSGEYIPEWFPDPRGAPSIPALFLDEVPVNADAINSLSIESIAYVKGFRPPFIGAFLNGSHGAIAIYSKRGYSPGKGENSNQESGVLHGYTRFKEFATDALDSPREDAASGYYPVLYFNPYVLTNNNNQHIRLQFYNRGLHHNILIVLEGINAEGKMARVIKMIP